MEKYIELLKEYWQSNNLTFIATLNKISDDYGYFNHFINPNNKKKLFYPVFDNIEVDDRRISFPYSYVRNLINGDYYEVRLTYTNDPRGKNNPYSLKIKNVSMLNQEKVMLLLEEKKTHISNEDVYYGCYKKKDDRFAVFENVMHNETGEILLKERKAQMVFVNPSIPLEENAYYSFSISENPDKPLPSAIPNTIKFLEINPYQEYIRLRFERLNNPEANSIIANMMREIGKGMYSSKQRMIFELLQNADDAPGKEKVEFHIDSNGEYFFVMHDGAPFNKDDVEAITSAAESTKRGDNKKTGYKGIGFKSVFTDSSEVWLKSGGYQFAFIKESPLFHDFDKFYFSSERYKKYPELLKEDQLKYRNQKRRFDASTDIPWQIIPIWKNQFPSEFNDSNFNNFNNPVQFALKLGKINIEDYILAIGNIIKRPQFILFLRNTSKFKSQKNRVTITRKDYNEVIEIVKTTAEYEYHNSQPKQIEDIYHYTKQTFDNIVISDEAFSELNIGLKKQFKVNNYDETVYFFTDIEGNKIETIPPKLASATKTEISFGIFLVNGKISPEQQYVNNIPKYSSLFTYLPMEDTRFRLPFLVNADFVPSSDRQKIQGDNLWNKYIMIKVAEKHIETLYILATKFTESNLKYNTYLSLLLKNTIPEDDTAQQIIDSYNNKYLEHLKEKPIVVNDLNQQQLLSQTIIDDSGLIELLGYEIFYEIIKTEKRLPHQDLDVSYLKNYEYLDVEIIAIKELAKNITPECCERLGQIIEQKTVYNKPELLEWLNKLAEYISKDYFCIIPFIAHNGRLFSIKALLSESDAWIINKNTIVYEELIKGLGYHTINLQLEKYSNINYHLLSINEYVNDKTLAYKRIESKNNLSNLDISIKLKLIDFLQNSEFMKGIGEMQYFSELKLFVDDKGIPRSLRQLLSRQNIIAVNSLLPFRISENEYNALTDALRKELIQRNKVFTSFILNKQLFDEWSSQFCSQNINEYNQDIKTIFSWKEDEVEIQQNSWASIPWLYIDDELRFLGSEKVFWSESFRIMPFENYQSIKDIFHKSKLKILPIKDCGELVSLFKIKTDNTLINDWTKVCNLDTIAANVLLDWMEADGTYNNFFDKYTFVGSPEGNWLIQKAEKEIEEGNVKKTERLQIYDGSDALKSYINEIEGLKQKFSELNISLCSENRNKIGLLQGDRFLNAIIDSKAYNQKLAIYIPSNSISKFLGNFIFNLSEFILNDKTDYNSSSPEHILINSLLKSIDDTDNIPSEIQNLIDNLRSKIKINNNPLSEYDLSDRVQFGKGDDKKLLKLSDVLEKFKGESDVLDTLIESFVSITEKSKLRKLFFKTRQMSYNDICAKIEAEISLFYSVHQVVFQILYTGNNGYWQWRKQRFDAYWKNIQNYAELYSSYKHFLDIVLDLKLTELHGFNFIDLQLKNCVDKNWAVKSEKLPQWLEEWIKVEQNNRIVFLSKLGYNGIDSSIVKLRQAAISDNYDQNTVIRYYEETKSNMQLIWNTIDWLSNFNSKKISNNIELIKQINSHVRLNTPITTLTIPVIESINQDGIRSYILKSISTNNVLYVLNGKEELDFLIFHKLSRENEQILFVDEYCGGLSNFFKTEKISLTTRVDSELLEKNSKLWDEPYYRKWELFSRYQIYIYNEKEIPYKQIYKEVVISTFTEDSKIEIQGKFYVSKSLIKDVLNNLPSTFPIDVLTKLKEWHYKTLQDESLLDNDSFQYNESIDRLLQDRLGISRDGQKRESDNAKTHAIYFLHEEGYDISNVNSVGYAFTNIIAPDGSHVKCIVRSAKGGLLYLDKEHWDMLKDLHTQLVVIYPGNSPRLFKNRLELLEEELAENVLFRVPNSKQTSEIDDIFDALESESHLILVTSEKMRESLFSKLKKEKNSQEYDAAIGDDDFSF